jgi:hypothetical protein
MSTIDSNSGFSEAPSPGGWQPIGTAPRDGSEILVHSDNGVRVAHWNESSHRAFTGWFIPMDNGSAGMMARNATCWMHLPEPPVSCACGGDPDQPPSHHDISCPAAINYGGSGPGCNNPMSRPLEPPK